MSSRYWFGLAIAVVLVVNVEGFLGKPCQVRAWDATRAESRAEAGAKAQEKKAKELAMVLRSQAPDIRDEKYLAGIGSLARPRWRTKLSLTPGQVEALNKLDKLVWDGRTESWLSDAEYVETHPTDYHDYMARSHARRRNAPDHARSMVAFGLLSDPQAAAVTRTTVSAREMWLRVLRDTSYLRDLIGITDAQLASLQESSQGKVETILTKRQLELLDQLTKESKVPIAQPDFPDLSDDAATKISVEEISTTFRNLATLDLTPDQRRLLSDLHDVVRQGLSWISKQELPDAAKMRSKFIQHAEQVALQGILTQEQANQVQAKLGKR